MPTRSTSSSSNGSSSSSAGSNRGGGGREGAGLSAYEKVMGRIETSSSSDPAVGGSGSAADVMRMDGESAGALSSRLAQFRKWLSVEANVQVHPAICIVNGEATDGTKNAPVLVVDREGGTPGPLGGAAASSSFSATVAPGKAAGGVNAGRVGAVDWEGDQRLYDRTMGCQVRSTREIKTDEVMMTMPRGAFVTPDVVASSDAGRAVLACCQVDDPAAESESRGFWDAFENTTECEATFNQKVARNTAPQLLVKILQERKRVESNFNKRIRIRDEATAGENGSVPFQLIARGGLSTRAPLLAFLIQQRFADATAPLVASDSREANDQFQRAAEECSALRTAATIVRPPASPDSFAPYARTLPSFVSIPLCWRRSELALLASCLPGMTPLQDAAARTLQLASEFVALLDAGVLERFPATFPKGMLTWERWVWAAAVVSSRALPASAYVDAGVDVLSFKPQNPLEFQSPSHIWSELGVLIPLLDMLNHERDAHQVTWEPNAPAATASSNGADNEVAVAGHPPRAIIHKKVKKGSELFCCYGDRSNSYLIQQYGFAQLSNTCDDVKLGWGLADAVGHLDSPEEYVSLIPDDTYQRFLVFETTDDAEVKKWWTEDRLTLLGKEAFAKSDDGILENLKNGKKMFALANSDGTFFPILLTVLVVATMPKIELQKFASSRKESLVLSKRHQQVLRSYLAFFFSRKLEKLLQNVSAGLKDHFNTGKLWTQVAKGGLRYAADEGDNDGYIGWQAFFDSHVYKATMEVEDHYYAMGAESCVLALYDGNLRALQSSLDAVCDDDKFAEHVLRQIEELGFGVASDKDDGTMSKDGTSPNSDRKSPKNRKRSKQKTSGSSTNDADSTDRPVAIKIHVGNLSFQTTPSDMYDYFSSLYGKDNVLECHIPVERETGRSRGFGFVTMPEPVAYRVLESTQKHEIGGRLIKLARSNSAGTNPAGRSQQTEVLAANERCSKCGYRPKYCTCGGGESRSRSDQPSRERPRDARPDDRDPAYFAPRDRDRDRDRDRYRDRGYRDYPPSSDHYAFEREDRYGRPTEAYGDDRYRSNSRRERHDDDRGRSPRDYSPDRRGRSHDDEYYYRRSRRDEDDDRRSIRKRSRSASRSRSRSRDRSRRRKSRKRSRSYSPVVDR